MSVIAWDGKTLAADKQIIAGDTITTGTKIRRLPCGAVVAATNDVANGQKLIKWYADGADPEKFPSTSDDDGFSRLIVADKDGCREYTSNRGPEPIEVENSFMAWGTGREAALGAMEMGAGAARAVEVASKWVVGCGRGFDSFVVNPGEWFAKVEQAGGIPPVPGVGPILNVSIGGGVLSASRKDANSKDVIMWTLRDGEWK